VQLVGAGAGDDVHDAARRLAVFALKPLTRTPNAGGGGVSVCTRRVGRKQGP
jgi:hypothetical protein